MPFISENADQSYRILIAEDDKSVGNFVRRALEMSGHQVDMVENGFEALEALQGSKHPYDLLLTDIVMPGLDGVALALKANKSYPEMKILMMTGFSHERQRAHNLDFLIHDVIAKPFTLDQLQKAVKDVLQAPLP